MENGGKAGWAPKNTTAIMMASVRKAAVSVRSDVELDFFGSGASPAASLDSLQICQMLRDTGPNIKLKVYDAEGDKEECREASVLFFPAILILGRNKGSMIFLGNPTGYGLLMLADAVLLSSTGEPGLKPKTLQKLSSLKRPVEVKVFISPESECCARNASLAFRMAVESPLVRAEVINAPDFPVLSQRYRVETTPRTIVNDVVEFNGARAEDEFMEKLLGAVVPQGEMYR